MKYNTVKKVYSIEKCIRDMDELNGIRLDYPLQRAAGQWSGEQKSNLIRKILEDCEIPEIKLASQINPLTGIETKWLIDGKQRLSTIRDFYNDGFSLGKKTRFYDITYQTYEYETIEKRGKTVYKLDKQGKRIPILDEDGYKIPVEKTIDIRGLRYSTLPPELQELFDNYQIDVKIIVDATDLLIQKELRDMNSGSQMNSEQIGMNCLGIELANKVTGLANHPFIKDYCGFSDNDKIKARHLRSIYESLLIINYPDEWKTNCEEISGFLSAHIQQEQLDELKYMLDSLYDIFQNNTQLQTPEIKSFLRNKEFFVIMDNFHKFLDKGYILNSYGEFLFKWITELQFAPLDTEDEDEESSYAIVSGFHTKNKSVVVCRQDIMQNALDEYLSTYCSNEFIDFEFNVDENLDEATENNIVDNVLKENSSDDSGGQIDEKVSDKIYQT